MKIGRTPLIINNIEDTKLSDDEYQRILNENGLRDFVKNFLVEVAVYFWKMAKASGKVVETTVDEYLANLQKQSSSSF